MNTGADDGAIPANVFENIRPTVIAVCDLAHEELGPLAAVHWSVPDPVPAGDPGSFDLAVAELDRRVRRLAPRLAAS